MGKMPPVSRHQSIANPDPKQPLGNRSKEQRDQRIKSRFRANSLTVTIKRRSCLGLVRWSHQTHCLDINRYGVGLISPTPLARGAQVSLDFQGQYITQSGVKAEVVSRKPAKEGGYRLSLRFVYCAYQQAYCRKLDNALSRIEAMYRQKTSH
ncbi:MAG: PilZ domain-containing protein [Halomonadaceae bacterium]|nr:MAG: PilZ domain-containing protein [Halomonadaceae bacterium]